MRAIFLQYARYSGNLVEQVQQLDKMVIEETVPKIISNIKQYMGYYTMFNNYLSHYHYQRTYQVVVHVY